VILGIYFVVGIGIGFVARLAIKTDLDFFLSGRSLPAWITGLAFIAANLAALEILGQAANGAQYGVPAVHYYWIGAVPAMIFLGLVMMPFYYGAKVRSVPAVRDLHHRDDLAASERVGRAPEMSSWLRPVPHTKTRSGLRARPTASTSAG
jgi:solute:Na+ symporter, SSS family